MSEKGQKTIILFDGICNLCNGAVQFLLKRDVNEQFLFASLQSDAAKNILLQYNVKKIKMDSIIFIEDDQLYQKSTAVLKICRYLNWPWTMISFAGILPLRFRDKIYDVIAKHRYKWFGRKDTCTMMMPKYKNRFI
ncbi:thiol-disulfide oxidoreductase DCC family protein [Lutimonas halocynthiae]|uniref:thiol-disulfide oxidoreductase DCC family protein n=1 Tax=Lutimonas halocynthiae TaxID=1446477 RepID=UPI0025B5BDF7|nr:thiol-disulfide oxidoreductase DCC family protein [Lutimonas halocynthiae]MDN3644182.1 thiol-disulfide oxidoreductase DCC family protein [Lutimonas halocynthiae]